MCPWFLPSPNAGGTKIPPEQYPSIIRKANAYMVTRPRKSLVKLQLRFKNQFCYVDSLEKDGTISPLGRLRYFRDDKWAAAFYTYSNDRYELCCLPNGKWFGSFEEALSICETYL